MWQRLLPVARKAILAIASVVLFKNWLSRKTSKDTSSEGLLSPRRKARKRLI
jgi:hypothetical protein